MLARVAAVDAAAVSRVARRIIASSAPAISALGQLQGLASHDRIAASFR
jgi:hypothetical protein